MPRKTEPTAPAPIAEKLGPEPLTSGQLTVPPPAPPPVAALPAKRPWWIWAGLAACVLLVGVLLYVQPWVAKGLAVKVETIAPAPLLRVLAVNGRVAPLHLVGVKPTVGGIVVAVLQDEGATVRRGDVLARVDASAQQAMVRQALAGLDAGLAAQSQAAASLTRAEALRDTIARVTLEDAQIARQRADQEVARLTAAFDQTQIDLAKYTILAPISGTVLTRHAEVGQVVDLTVPMFTLADLGQLVVETDVDESYAAKITTGLAAVLQLKGDTAKQDGHVSFVASQVDAATGGLAVKIAFDKAVTAPVGLTVTANIIVDRQDAAIAVPRAALARDASGAAVFVAMAGHAVRRAVRVIDWPADRVQVTLGLAAGDVVITDATGLRDGLVITMPAVPANALAAPGA